MDGKIHPMPRKEVLKILNDNGFQVISSKKHTKLKKRLPSGEVLTTLVSHHSKIQPHLIKCIIRQSKKPEEEFY